MLSHGEESGRDADEWREARGEDGPHCPVLLMRMSGWRDTPHKRKKKKKKRMTKTEWKNWARKERTSKTPDTDRMTPGDWRRGRKTF